MLVTSRSNSAYLFVVQRKRFPATNDVDVSRVEAQSGDSVKDCELRYSLRVSTRIIEQIYEGLHTLACTRRVPQARDGAAAAVL